MVRTVCARKRWHIDIFQCMCCCVTFQKFPFCDRIALLIAIDLGLRSVLNFHSLYQMFNHTRLKNTTNTGLTLHCLTNLLRCVYRVGISRSSTDVKQRKSRISCILQSDLVNWTSQSIHCGFNHTWRHCMDPGHGSDRKKFLLNFAFLVLYLHMVR